MGIASRTLAAALALYFFSALTTSIPAGATTIVCDGCGDFNTAARNIQVVGIHYVINSTTGVTKKCDVRKVKVWVVTCDNAELPILRFTQFVAQNSGNNAPYVAIGVGSGELPLDGYDMVKHPEKAANVGEWIKDGGWGLVNDFLLLTAGVNPIVGFDPSAVTITIRVHMTDGSTALFKYSDSLKTWVRIPGQTRDASGNIIPESAPDVAPEGTVVEYTFESVGDLAGFLDRLLLLGVPITGPATPGKPIVCVTDPDTKKVVCEVQGIQ